MAITSISKIQQRRGVKADLPVTLSEGEFGWCLDTRELFIGNSSGFQNNTEILTEYSNNSDIIVNKFKTFASNIQPAIVRPIGSKLNDIASIKDFGAKGDGVTDDAPAINAAISSLLFTTGSPTNASIASRVKLYFPAGTYLINSPISLFPFLTIIGDGYGKTIISAGNIPMPCMIQTADSRGQTGSNIGTSGATLPTRIFISDLTITTNNISMDIAHLDRYSAIRFENVEMAGGWIQGTGTTNSHAAFRLQSIGNAVSTYDFQMVGGVIRNVTHGIYADDPIVYTTLTRVRIHHVYRGLNIGQTPNFGGPAWTSVSQSRFYTIDDAGVIVFNNRPGVISTSNTYIDCCLVSGAAPVYWGVSTLHNASMGDVFNVSFGVDNLGTTNLVFNPQQNGFVQRKIRNVTSPLPIVVGINDDILIIRKPIPSPTFVTLPGSPNIGNNYTIKDGLGIAQTYNITITAPVGLIDGSPSVVMTTNYQSITMVYDGTNWNII